MSVFRIALLALAGVALLASPWAATRLAGAVALIIAVPGLAAVRAWGNHDDTAGVAGAVAAFFAGLAVAIVSLWIVGVLFGLSPVACALAPAVGGLALAASTRRKTPVGSDPDRRMLVRLAAVSLVAATLGAATFAPYGFREDARVHRPGMTDWYKHLSVAVTLGGSRELPPPNPFLATENRAPYYDGFYLCADAVHRSSRGAVDVFACLLGLTLLVALALPWVTYRWARGVGALPREAWIAATAASLLGGFDIVPWALELAGNAVAPEAPFATFAWVREIVPSTHLDSWVHHDERQFSPPLVATIWAPQHVLAALFAVLAIDALRPGPTDSARPAAGPWLPAFLLGALPGTSAYVAIATAAGLATVPFAEAVVRRCRPWETSSFRRGLGPVLAAALLAAPAVALLSSGETSLHWLVPAAGSWRNGALFTTLLGDATVSRLLDTPALLVFELGILGLLGVRGVLRLGRTALVPATVMFVVIALVTLVRSGLDGPNNLFARATLVVWILAAPFAVMEVRARPFSLLRKVAVGFCAAFVPMAIAGAFVEGALFRSSPAPWVDALRAANEATPNGERVVIDPVDLSRDAGYWLRRPALLGDRRHALLFGASAEEYDDLETRLAAEIERGDGRRLAALLNAVGGKTLVTSRLSDAPRCFEPVWQAHGHFVHRVAAGCSGSPEPSATHAD